MNRKTKKIISMIILLIIMTFTLNITYARFDEGDPNDAWEIGHGQNIDNDDVGTGSSWWSDAGSFFKGAAANTNISALQSIIDLIKFVGNIIFVMVTVVLGVKYIWGGVDSKAEVKDSLVTLAVAACMFYGYTTITNLFKTGDSLVFIDANSYQNTALNIYSTILYICNYLAVGGLVYIGLKYMMAGAEGRASLKAKGVPVVLGIVMVYATITFLNLIVTTMTQVVQ